MNEDKKLIDPSEESLREMPEQDFSHAIRPNRYANLRGAFQRAVFVDRDVWEHFGSEERILEVLTLLVDIAKKRSAWRRASGPSTSLGHHRHKPLPHLAEADVA